MDGGEEADMVDEADEIDDDVGAVVDGLRLRVLAQDRLLVRRREQLQQQWKLILLELHQIDWLLLLELYLQQLHQPHTPHKNI